LEVLLLSVDPEYFPGTDRYKAQSRKILEKHKLDCPQVLLPGGWADVGRVFNANGYGNILVDAKGIVRGTDLHGKELEKVVAEVVGKPRADRPDK
jgi:hypothetical protein